MTGGAASAQGVAGTLVESRLRRFLAPRTVAFIGGREAEAAALQCRNIGFAGEIWPVNPRREAMAGEHCFASVTDLPTAPDAAFVVVPPAAAIETVRSLSELGCAGALVHTSGFAEVGGDGIGRQAALVTAAGDMPLLGPNCWGYVNFLDRAALWPDLVGGKPCDRGVAIISQSGNLAITLAMQDRSLPVGYLLSVGNQACTNESQIIEALVGDERVSAVGLLVEGLTDVQAFQRAVLAARARQVPVVVLKTGRSALGAGVTLSHTATLSGDDLCYQALFERLGVPNTHSQTEFLETLKLLHVTGPLNGRRLLSMSCSGGEAALMADLAAPLGLEMPGFEPEHAERLAECARLSYPPGNPFDYHTYVWGDEPATQALFREAAKSDVDVAALVIDLPRGNLTHPPDTWVQVASDFAAAVNQVDGLAGVLISGLPECFPEDFREQMMAKGVTPLQGMTDALRAVRHAATIGESWQRSTPAPLINTSAVAQAETEGRRTLDEASAKRALNMAGVPVPEGDAVSPEDVGRAAEVIGYPVVLKAVSAKLAHKTEAGGVAVGLNDARAVSDALERMRHLSGLFLVEACVEDAVAEMMVGVRSDPLFGLALVVGFGGTSVELLKDTRTLLLPVSAHDVERAIAALRLAPLLEGFRGREKADIDGLVRAVLDIAAYAQTNADRLLELDVNPLMVTPNRCVAADALMVMRR